MKRHWKSGGFFKDDRGVALTEFVVVIPVVFLLFFAMQQYYVIVRTTQLANYAAYTAARSYAVRIKANKAPDSNSPKSAAQSAAALAMAPVTTLSRLPGSSGSDITTLGVNFATAKAMFTALPGIFSVTTGKVGSHDMAVATVNYPQPINIPIFSSIWNFVAGNDINFSMLPLSNATSLGLSFTGMPYINVPAKATTGCEKWSGKPQKIDKNPPKWQ